MRRIVIYLFFLWETEDDVSGFDVFLHIGGEAVKVEELDFKREIAFDKDVV
jgi:hypothetical protein